MPDYGLLTLIFIGLPGFISGFPLGIITGRGILIPLFRVFKKDTSISYLWLFIWTLVFVSSSIILAGSINGPLVGFNLFTFKNPYMVGAYLLGVLLSIVFGHRKTKE
jgi:hypothetical protein